MHKDYVCDKCKRKGCKLWRDYQTLADHTRLLCRGCAEADQYKHAPFHGDQIGWMVPAVPDRFPDSRGLPEGYSWWGYTSVPQEGVDWWKCLGD